jgi:hypothetical protein
MNIEWTGSFPVGIVLTVGGLWLLLGAGHRATVEMFMRASAEARERAREGPWPWWRWPRPTERVCENVAWLAGLAVLGLGIWALVSGLV